jgi:hypothetical protein
LGLFVIYIFTALSREFIQKQRIKPLLPGADQKTSRGLVPHFPAIQQVYGVGIRSPLKNDIIPLFSNILPAKQQDLTVEFCSHSG